MILRATFENILSFHEETSISFVAGKGTSLASHVCRGEKKDDIPVLKSGVAYGANASGKSNMIRCINLLKRIALEKEMPKENWDVFKLGAERKNKSKIELEFKIEDVYYAYGVVFNLKGIQEEWLYKINKRTDTLIFERKHELEETEYKFGKIVGDAKAKQFLEFLSEGTPKNRSFLSEYNRRNGKGMEAVSVVYHWFDDCLKIVFPETHFREIVLHGERNQDYTKEVKQLLQIFNTGIYDIKRVKISKEEVKLPTSLINEFIAKIKPKVNFSITTALNSKTYFFEMDKDENPIFFEQKMIHKNVKDEDVYFEMDEESDGSVRLLDFIPMLIDFRLNPVVYLIDEIDRSMHPMMSQKIFELYYQTLSENRNTQLICTTHESHLLNTKKTRADEIWFTEKGRNGATQFTSLAEYKPREDVRKGYLQGRYGAIPFFASTKLLNWHCDEEA
jgi:AAA15 family ATPase/GTPase